MAQAFNLTAQLQLQGPRNVNQVVNDIRRQLKPVGVKVNIQNTRNLARANKDLQSFNRAARDSRKNVDSLNRTLQESARRFSVITIATGSFLALANSFKNSVKEAVAFERELVRISQVTGKSTRELKSLSDEVTRLSTSLGASSKDLLNVARTLSQAGFAADDTRRALDILAKTSLGATFDNIQDTTEGAIALLRQFSNEARSAGGDIAFLEKSLDAINSVSKRFAVESGDLISVIRRTGGVFSAAGGSVNELIALFTSVRATTRESAETIATGLRTIFTRIQRTETIQQLKALNIELQDSQGRFVGAFEAVKRLSRGLSGLDPRDFRFSQIVEELGGFRQIGKVIPLINQFATAQEALNVAQGASGSVSKDAITAQQSLGVQVDKVRQQFDALIRKFADSSSFKSIAGFALKLAEAFIKVADALEPVLPLLTSLAFLKLGSGLAPAVAGLAGIGRRTGGAGPISKFARGGMVPGVGNRDTVPAMLTPGEFVIRKSSVNKLGAGTLAAMNENGYAAGGKVTDVRYNYGIPVASTGRVTKAAIEKASTSDLNEALKNTNLLPASRAAIQEKLNQKSKAKPDKTTDIRVTGATLGEQFGVAFLDGLPKDISSPIKSMLKASNATGKGRFFDALKRSANRQEVDRGIAPDKRVKTGQQALARYVPDKTRILAPFASQNATVLQGEGKKIFNDEIAAGIPRLFQDATKKFKGELAIGAQVPLNKLLSNSAIGSIEGQFFEAYIRNVTGKIVKDKNDAIFDFAAGSLSDSKKDLDRMFGPGAFNTGIAQEFKNRGGAEQVASAIGKGLSIGTAGDLRFSFMNKGGGISGSDTVPAMLTPGEFVFNKSAAKSIGYDNLKRMNKQGVQGFAKGGAVGVQSFKVGGGVEAQRQNLRNFYAGQAETRQAGSVKSGLSANAIVAAEKRIQELGISSQDASRVLVKYKQGISKGLTEDQALQAAEKDYLNRRKEQISLIQKSNQEIQKNNTLRKKLGGALAKAGSTVGGAVVGGIKGGYNAAKEGRAAAGAQLNQTASGLQNFVFLGAMVSSMTASMSGLNEVTKQAINETAGFATGLVGIGSTLIQTFTASSVASLNSAAADDVEAGSSLAASGAGGKLAGAMSGFAIGAAAAVIGLKYFSAQSRAEADKLGKGISESLNSIKEGGASNVNDIKKYTKDEIELRKKSSAQFSSGALATAGTFALAGAAIGSFVPVLGTAVGGLVGGLLGAGAGVLAALGLVKLGAFGTTKAREDEIKSIYNTIDSLVNLNQNIANLNTASQDLSRAEAAGVSSEEIVSRGLQAGGAGAGSGQAGFKDAQAQLRRLAEQAGKSADQLTKDDFSDNAEGLSLFNLATQEAAAAQEFAAARTRFTTENLQRAFRNVDPSKTFDELIAAGGPFAQALKQNIGAVQEESKIRQEALRSQKLDTERQIKGATGRERSDLLIKSQEIQDQLNKEKEREKQLVSDIYNGYKTSQNARNQEVIAIREAQAAQVAMTQALRETEAFLAGINTIELNLDKQASAIDNFAAVVDNATLKIKASGVDEIGNISNVSNIGKFDNQISSITQKFGPQAEKIGDELVQTASVLKNSRSLLGEDFTKGDPISSDQVLKNLGITSQMLGPGGEKIFQEMSAALQKASSEGQITEEALNKIFAPIENISKNRADAIKKLIDVEQKSIDNYQKFLDVKEKLRDQEVQQKQREVEAIKNSADLRAKADELIAKSTGREQNPADVARATRQRNQQARRVRNQAQLSGIRVNGQQLDAGNAGNVAAVRQQAITERKQVQQQIAAGNSSRDLIKRQQQLKVVIDSTTKVLEDFADQGDAANDIFAEMEANISLIEKEKNARQQMLGVIEEFVVGGQDARKNLIQASQGIRLAFATGTLQNQTPEQRQATVSLLDKLADIELAPGFTGREIKQELVLRDAIRMGLDPEIAKQLATATSTEEKLINANKILAEEINKLTAATVESTKALDPQALSTGGMVQYRAAGGTIFKPRGTDTVPAMLTPGEFVIRKSAVDKIGVGNLQALNNGGGTVSGFANGGPVYLHNGGEGSKNRNYRYHTHDSNGNERPATNRAEAFRNHQSSQEAETDNNKRRRIPLLKRRQNRRSTITTAFPEVGQGVRLTNEQRLQNGRKQNEAYRASQEEEFKKAINASGTGSKYGVHSTFDFLDSINPLPDNSHFTADTEFENSLDLIRQNLYNTSRSGRGPKNPYSRYNEKDVLDKLKSQGYGGISSELTNHRTIKPVSGAYGSGVDDKILDFMTLLNENFTTQYREELKKDKPFLNRDLGEHELMFGDLMSKILQTDTRPDMEYEYLKQAGLDTIAASKSSLNTAFQKKIDAKDAFYKNAPDRSSEIYAKQFGSGVINRDSPDETDYLLMTAKPEAPLETLPDPKVMADLPVSLGDQLRVDVSNPEIMKKIGKTIVNDANSVVKYRKYEADVIARANDRENNPNFPLRGSSVTLPAPQIPGPRNINDFTSASEIIARTSTASQPQQPQQPQQPVTAPKPPPSYQDWEFVGYKGPFKARVVGGGGDYVELESEDGRIKRFKFDQFAGASRSQAIQSRNDFLKPKKGSGFGGTQDVGYFFGGGFINPFNTFPMMMGQMNAGTNFMMNMMPRFSARPGMTTNVRAGVSAHRRQGVGQKRANVGMPSSVLRKTNQRNQMMADPHGFTEQQIQFMMRRGAQLGINVRDDMPITIFRELLARDMQRFDKREILQFYRQRFGRYVSADDFLAAESIMNRRGRQLANEGRDTPIQFASGGKIPYLSRGGASGGDSIPAMLTPGEFVMSANAVKRHGVGFMQSLNRGNVPGFNKGGMVQYRQEGGVMGALGGPAQSIGIDTSKIEGVFGGFVDNFSAVFDNILLPFNGIMQGLNNIADKFGNFVMSHKIEDINVNMPDLAKLDGMIASSVKKAIEEALPKTNNDNKDFRSN